MPIYWILYIYSTLANFKIIAKLAWHIGGRMRVTGGISKSHDFCFLRKMKIMFFSKFSIMKKFNIQSLFHSHSRSILGKIEGVDDWRLLMRLQEDDDERGCTTKTFGVHLQFSSSRKLSALCQKWGSITILFQTISLTLPKTLSGVPFSVLQSLAPPGKPETKKITDLWVSSTLERLTKK